MDLIQVVVCWSLSQISSQNTFREINDPECPLHHYLSSVRLMTYETFVADFCCTTLSCNKSLHLQLRQMQLQQNAQQRCRPATKVKASDIMDSIMHIHEHSCTSYMCDECLRYDTCTPYTCMTYMYDVHVS